MLNSIGIHPLDVFRPAMRLSFFLLYSLLAVPAAARADAPMPVLATEMAECRRIVGPEASPPAATDYPGGISRSGNGLTPATAPGATTVPPKLAACLISAMGRQMLVLQVVSDPNGIRDAHVMPIGAPRELTAEENKIVANNMAALTQRDLNRAVLVYCHHTSCMLSYNAALRLSEAGYKNVLWMREGIKGWKEAGLPVGPVRDARGAIQRPQVALTPRPRTVSPAYPAPPKFYARTRYDVLKPTGLTVGKLCLMVGQRMENRDGPKPGPAYRAALFQAAGVDLAKDHEGVVKRKMQNFWQRYGDYYECGSSPSFGGISVFKQASRDFYDAFLDDVIDRWELPLNKVDVSDGWTLLDYLQDRHDARPDDDRVKALYTKVRHAGGLTRAELEEKGLIKRPELLQAEYLALHKKAAEGGDTDSMWYLARAYAGGQYVAQNRSEGTRWFERLQQHALATRDVATMVWIGYAYQDDDRKIRLAPADERQFYQWMRRAADGNEPTGMLWAGRGLAYGRGVTGDVPAAIAMLEKAYAVKGEDLVALELGRIYDKLGDIKTAATWLRLAPGLQPVSNGVMVEDWFKLKGVPLCGPRAGGNSPLAC